MRNSSINTTCTSRGLALALAMAALGIGAQAQSAPSASGPKMEDVYKNIQVLKGLPADQMLITMRFIRASLGVACTYCHAEPEGDAAKIQPPAHPQPGWWADEPAREVDTPRKEIARKMMRMTAELNRQSFGGHNEITCFTCHRGSLRPASNYEGNLVSVMAKPAADAKAASGASVDELLNKFISAIGGASAVQKVTSRVEKGSVQSGSLLAERAAGRNQPAFEVEISAKAPAMRAVLTSEGNGVLRGFSSDKGWQQGRISTDPRHQPRDMRDSERDNVKMEDPYFFAAQLKQLISGMRVTRLEKVGGKDTYVVAGRMPALPEVQLYFDKESGMLVRLTTSTQGLLGNLPIIVDYSDFREVDGVKVPFRWVNTDVAEGLSFTYALTSVQQNVSVDETKFVRPAAYMYLFGPEKK